MSHSRRPPPLVVGVGQTLGGDDAVGLRVARLLARLGVNAREAADPSDVIGLLEGAHAAVVVDALVDGGPPGRLMLLDPRSIPSGPTLSSHGLGLAGALRLSRALGGPRAVVVLAVTIAPPERGARGLSPQVARAVKPAARTALALLHGWARRAPPGPGPFRPRAKGR